MKNILILILSVFIILGCSQTTTQHTREIAQAKVHLQKVDGTEEIKPGVKELLHEEQNLHNKDLWGADAFSSDIAPEYVPENNPKFPLAYYLLPEQDAKFLQSTTLDNRVSFQLQEMIDGKKYFKLFVHPESEEHYEFLNGTYKYVSQAESEFTASPTSSYRSLIVWNHQDTTRKSFIAKVSLNKNVIGSIDRLVSANEVERSIANQMAFEKIGHELLSLSGAVIYPETAGLVLKNSIPGAPAKLGGQLIREIPDDVVNSRKKWISFSALMSPNKKPLPLIMDVIKASNLTSYDFIQKYMIESYMNMFEKVSFIQGMNFEPHSQNLGFEVDMNLRPTSQWVIRDFGGVWPDVVAMAKNNGPVEVYMDQKSAEKFKLPGGRANYISSFVFFYKRQVFDMMISQIAKHDPLLTKDKRVKLNIQLNKSFMKMIETHLGLKLLDVPNMTNYKKIESKIMQESFVSDKIEKVPLEEDKNLQFFIELKREKKERIDFTTTKKSTKFHMTNHGIYELAGSKIISLTLYNKKDLEEYKNKTGMFAKFKIKTSTSAMDCFNLVRRMYARPD